MGFIEIVLKETDWITHSDFIHKVVNEHAVVKCAELMAYWLSPACVMSLTLGQCVDGIHVSTPTNGMRVFSMRTLANLVNMVPGVGMGVR